MVQNGQYDLEKTITLFSAMRLSTKSFGAMVSQRLLRVSKYCPLILFCGYTLPKFFICLRQQSSLHTGEKFLGVANFVQTHLELKLNGWSGASRDSIKSREYFSLFLEK